MSEKKEETAAELRSRAGTARRLAVQLVQAADREKLLEFAAELEAKADRLDRKEQRDTSD
jgi:hypothetical protein